MDRTLLRTLTEKSCLGFGKYEYAPIRQILDLGFEGKDYLVYVYYHSHKVNFIDEILMELGITTEFRIEKPGKCKNTWYRFRNETYDGEAWNRVKHQDKQRLKDKKMARMRSPKVSHRDYNHGHRRPEK